MMKKATLFALLLWPLNAVYGQVRLNEFLASNAANLTDPDFGENADWVELHNAGSSAADLTGWHLSDDPRDSTKWAFPIGTFIPSGGFLLVWTDGQGIGLHPNFKLSADGESLALYDPNGTLMQARRSK